MVDQTLIRTSESLTDCTLFLVLIVAHLTDLPDEDEENLVTPTEFRQAAVQPIPLDSFPLVLERHYKMRKMTSMLYFRISESFKPDGFKSN